MKKRIILSITLMLLAATAVYAGTKEWIGTAGTFSPEWSLNSNWKGVGGAGPNDDLVFSDRVCNIFNYFSPQQKQTSTNDLPINTNFNSLTLSGTSYRIRGNQIFLTNGIEFGTSGHNGGDPLGSTTFEPNIILGDSQTWHGRFGTLTMNGVINLNGHQLSITGIGDLIFNGLMNGFGPLDVDTTENVFINGNASAHPLRLRNGNVQLGAAGSLGAVQLFGGTISGTGSAAGIDGRCGSVCTISPGKGDHVPGVLRVTADTLLGPQTKLAIDLNGPRAGTDYDILKMQGNADLSLGSPGLGADLDVSIGFTPTVGQQFVIVTRTGGGVISGQFRQGTALVVDNQLFFVSYLADSVVLTAQGPVGP